MRSTQLDALRLDTELVTMLREQFARVFAFFQPVGARTMQLLLPLCQEGGGGVCVCVCVRSCFLFLRAASARERRRDWIGLQACIPPTVLCWRAYLGSLHLPDFGKLEPARTLVSMFRIALANALHPPVPRPLPPFYRVI